MLLYAAQPLVLAIYVVLDRSHGDKELAQPQCLVARIFKLWTVSSFSGEVSHPIYRCKICVMKAFFQIKANFTIIYHSTLRCDKRLGAQMGLSNFEVQLPQFEVRIPDVQTLEKVVFRQQSFRHGTEILQLFIHFKLSFYHCPNFHLSPFLNLNVRPGQTLTFELHH